MTTREQADQNLVPRFLAKVLIGDGCWQWQGGRFNTGYGVFHVLGRSVGAHRFAYELWIGPIPEGLTLDHLCRNRAYVNPAHLEPVTRGENVLRGEGRTAQQKRQTECLHGHPFSDENTYTDPRGRRVCRTCMRSHWRAYRQRKAVHVP